MPLTIILAVGVDSALLASQRPFWEAAGCYVTPVVSIREAIIQFRDGDFDLILLGYSLPIESRERLTFLIRASGSWIPVICISDSPGDHDGFADATVQNEGEDVLQVIEELSATPNGLGSQSCEADERPQPHLLGDMRTLQMLWPRRTSKPGGEIR